MIVVATLAATAAVPVHGASRFWTGVVNGNFSTPGNWVGNVAPTNSDDIVFQAGITRLLVTNDFVPNRPFNTMLFQGSNYVVRGSPIILSNGLSSINPVGPNTVDAEVEVRASQAWEAEGPLASIDINGDIDLNANTLTVRAATGDFSFSGIIVGAGNIVKTNVGTLRMDGGTGHNAYSGFTRVDGGILELAKFRIIPSVSNFAAVPGDLTIGDGNGLLATDFVRLLRDDQIANTMEVTVRNSGFFDLNDSSDRIGSLNLAGGTVDSGTGTLTLGGNITTTSATNTAFINGTLSLGGASRTFDVNAGPAAADLRINASIIGGSVSLVITPGFTKTGAGSLFLAGTNTYNGSTTINQGQLALLTDRALGATETPLGNPAPTIVNDPGNLFLSNVQVTNENLTINSSNPGGAFNASGASIWTGDVSLNADTFISSSGTLLLLGGVSGAGGFTKISTGSMTFAGTNANTYTGTTTVRDGTLLLDKNTGDGGAMSGPLVIGEDELPANADIVQYLRCCQLPDDTVVTINASGLLDLNGFGENVGDLIFNGGDVDAPSPGSILPIGNITVNPNANSQAIISGRMSVGSGLAINVTGHLFSPDLSITAQVFGTGGLTKNGPGEVGLYSANTYSGQTIVNDGFLLVNHSLALGGTASGTVVNNGAVLGLNFGVAVVAESLSIAGTGQSNFGALSSGFGSNSWAGNIWLTGTATIYVDANDFLNVSGPITVADTASGASDLTKTGTGTLILSGGTANSFDGLILTAGTVLLDKSIANAAGPTNNIVIGDISGTDILRLGNDNQILDTTSISLNVSGRLDLNDQTETTGVIGGRGIIDLGSGTLREGADNESATFIGTIIGTGALFKLGIGTWTLHGDNTYTGQTTISAGTLVVNGLQPQSDVTVNGTANLGGEGAVGDVQIFGSIRPGNSPGVLTASNINFTAQGDYFVELNGSVAGLGYDQLNIRGTNQLGGSTLHLTVGGGFAPVEGERLTIINNDGAEAISGTFAGLPNASLLNAGGLQFRILYGNDVVLLVTNTALALGAGPEVETGNGNENIEPGECNQLAILLSNKLAGVVSGITATLSTTNPGVTVTQPFSPYPNLPGGAAAENHTPFQISTAPSLLCGTNINLLLTVHTATNGSFSIPIRMFTGTAGSPQRFNRTGDQTIPDLGSLDSTITVSGVSAPIHHVVISLHLSHTTDDNLDISIEDPDGTSVVLSSDNGGTLDDYGTSCADADRTTFSDAALTAIISVTAPFRGTFRPEQRLSIYRGNFGSDVNGTWHLNIADDTAGGLGTLHCWSIQIFPSVCQPGGGECEQCPGCPVRLNIAEDPGSTNRVLLQWSTAFPGFDLLSSSAVSPTSNYVQTAPAPIVVNGKYTVTNTFAGSNRFYILRKP